MQEARELIKSKIDRLPFEKLGKVISYVDFLAQEPEVELMLSPDDDAELAEIMAAGEYVDSAEIDAMIEAMPND